MKYLLNCFLLFISFVSFGQNQQKIDSLKSILTTSNTDSETFEALNQIIREFLTTNMDSTRVYNNKLLKLSKITKDQNVSMKGYNLASTFYYYNSQLDSCLILVKKSLSLLSDSEDYKMKSDIYRKLSILSRANSDFEGYEHYGRLSLLEAKKSGDWELFSSSLVVTGNIFFNKNDYSNALKFYLKVDSVHAINKGKTSNLCLAYENIALIYLELKNKDALNYLDMSKEIHEELGNTSGAFNCIRLKGNFYNKQKDYQNAIKYLSETIPFYESFSEPNKLIDVYSAIILAYAYEGKFKIAEKFIEKGLKITSQKEFSKFGRNAMQYSVGIFYLEKKDFQQAIYFLKKAETTTPSKGTDYYLRERKEISEALKKAYEGVKDFESAFKANERLLVLIDSLNIQNKEKITTEIETKYQTERKEQEIILLKSQNELAEQQKTNQRNQLLGGIGITSLAGLFFFFLYRNRQKTTKKLQELDKAKSNFFANISHEFRTPLTLISGPIQKQLQKESLPDEERSIFEMMHRNSTRLLSLVDQLLDISKIEAGSLKLKVAKKELIPFIGSLVDGFIYMAKQKELNYIVNNNPTKIATWFDRDVIEKIIVNLLSNAIKYTPTKGSIVCNAFVNDDQFHFEVKNTGLGLSKEEQTKIFERFYQLNENKQGVGIGLALVKELVNLHKGTITVHSIPEEWTNFKVVLPINKEEFKEIEIVDEVALKSTDMKSIRTESLGKTSEANDITDISKDPDIHQDSDNPILLMVDDNADIRTYVSSIFKNTYTILTAKNGQEGIDLAIEHIPDIIISDIMMPVKNGIELCNILKVDEHTSHIPIILLTAKAGDENEIEGVKTGADDYITKPFNEELLQLRVQKLIESRKKLQERYSQEVILRPKDIAITSVDEQFLERLQTVLDNKLIEASFRVEDFSQALGMSRMQLHRKLKALTGLSATEFIRSQRLKLAAQLLKKSEINVSQVGYSVGFNDHAYFSKCFKEMYHCTPTEYVNNTK